MRYVIVYSRSLAGLNERSEESPKPAIKLTLPFFAGRAFKNWIYHYVNGSTALHFDLLDKNILMQWLASLSGSKDTAWKPTYS